jgi:hypothetical protein
MRRGGAPAEVHHGAGGRSSEWFGAGAAVSLVHGCNRSAARSDDLASGQRARHKGHDIAAVAATVADARRGVERLRARYNAQGLQALGDLRCRNGRSPSVLKPDLLDKLQDRLPPGPPASRTACVSRPPRGAVDQPEGGGLDGFRARAGPGGAAARLGSPEGDRLVGDRLVGAEAAPAPSGLGHARGAGEEREAFKKSWSRPSLRREPSTRTRRSRSGPPTSTASA